MSPAGWKLPALVSVCLTLAATLELWIVIGTEQQRGTDHWLIFGLYLAVAVVAGAVAARRRRPTQPSRSKR